MFKKEKKTSGLVRRRKMKIAIDNCSTRLLYFLALLALLHGLFRKKTFI